MRATRALSKILFGGAQYRLEIGAAIAGVVEFKYFSAGDLSKQTGISKQSINHELRALEAAGLIARVPAGDDSPQGLLQPP